MRFFALIAVCLFALLAIGNVAFAQDMCPCPRNLQQVCGSDGTTYSNPCLLDCAAKRASREGRSLSLARDGAC